ncbi:hypothetical protein DEMA109039_13060 [Deinococcus marmoris]
MMPLSAVSTVAVTFAPATIWVVPSFVSARLLPSRLLIWLSAETCSAVILPVTM